MNKIYTFYSILALLVFNISTANAWTFTWNGSANTDWSNSSNWTRTGTNTGGNTVPGSADDVVINNGALTNQPGLVADVTILNLAMSAGVLDLNDYTITATSTASFTGGTVNVGNISSDSYTAMQNTTFNGLMIIYKTGSANNTVNGGNTFTGPLAVVNSSSGNLRMANSNPDTHLGLMHYERNGSGTLEPAYNGTNTFSGDISAQGSVNTVRFAQGNGIVESTGSATVYGSPVFDKLTINSTGTFYFLGNSTVTNLRIIKGGLHLLDNTLTVTDETSLEGGFIQSGTLRFDDMVNMRNTRFVGPLTLNKIGGGSNTVYGANSFVDLVTIINSDNSRFRMANNVGDTFRGSITFLENGTGELEPAYNGNNYFYANISSSGSGDDISYGAGNGNIHIVGNTTQSIVGDASQTPQIERLVMNTTGTLILNLVPLIIEDEITFTNGIIQSTSSDILIIENNATVTGASNSSHVNGPIRKIGNDAFTFPTGNGSVYAPIGISAPSNTSHHFTAQYFLQPYASLTVNGSLDHVSSEEHWILDRTNGSSNVRVTLSFNASERSGPIDNTSQLRVARFNGASWESSGNISVSGNTITTSSAVSNFSPFTLGSTTSLNPLPITLLNFNALPLEGNVIVKWTTTNEVNNNFFNVEKSIDGKNWISLAVIEGAKNSNMTLDYQHLDMNPVEGLQFYRLKQTDINGEFAYSQIVPVKFNSDLNSDVVLFPQPAGSILNVAVGNSEDASISVYNMMGQKLIEMNSLSGSVFQVDLSQLANGVYYLELNHDGVVSKSQIIKQ
ncbi:MAG: T9SS type A sorting domain-containing protein [Bacteroidia bacterium]